MSVRKAASPRSISSQASASETKSIPAPPYSSGTTIPRRPSSAMPSITPMSRWWLTSFSIASGRIRSSTNWRTVACTSRCSVESSRSTGRSVCPDVGLAALFQAALALVTAPAPAPAPEPSALLTPREKAALVVVSGLPAPRGVGGVIVRRWDREAQRPRDALVFVDQEGGDVRAFPQLPPATPASAFASRREALEAGPATGRALRPAGGPVDLA